MTDDNFTVIGGEKNEMRAALETMKRQRSELEEYNQLRAELRRKAYNAYIDQGFTATEALELCKDAVG